MGSYLSTFYQESNTTRLKNKYLGTFRRFSQEPFLSNHNKYKSIASNLTFKGTWDLRPEGGPGYGRQFLYNLPNMHNKDKERFVYKNLRFSSNTFNKVIDRCELTSNDNRIDKLYNSLFTTLRQFYNITDDTVIPFHFSGPDNFLPGSENTNYKIVMEALPKDRINSDALVDFNDLKVLVDVYSYTIDENENDASKVSEDLEYMMTAIEHCGGEYTEKEVTTFNLMFKEVSNQLIVNVSNNRKLEEFTLFLYGIDSKISLKDISMDNGNYIVKFSETESEIDFTGLNFANVYPIDNLRLDSEVRLKLDSNKDGEIIYFYNLYLQPMKFESSTGLLKRLE